MLIPGPDTRVIELRVHGILGTTAEELLDAVAAVDVAGDGAGRLVRPADRLRRPAPGAVLKADGRPLPRTLEGYVWGGLTSGGWAKAIWALLFPFSLANVSSWMLPPVPDGNRPAAALGVCCRALTRLAAILLTVLLVTQMAAVSMDLLATQCLAPTGTCLSIVPTWVRAQSAVRPAIGVLPLLVVVLVLAKVSHVNWGANAEGPHPAGTPRKLAKLPGATHIADPDAPALRTLHLTAALAATGLVALGGPNGPSAGGLATVSWTVAMVLLLVSVLGALVFGDPTGARPDRVGRWLLAALSPVPRRIVLTIAVLVVASVPAALPPLGTTLPGTDPTLTVVTVALGGTCLVLGLLLAPAALLARSAWAHQPAELRPWAGGWVAAPCTALAALLGGGFGAGVGITVRQMLGGVPLALPHGYAFVTLLWGVAAALAVAVLVVVAVVMGSRRLFLGARVPVEVKVLHADRPADAKAAASAWRVAGWERRHAHHVLLAVTAVLAAGALVSAAPWLGGALPPAWTQPLAAVGLLALAFLAGALLREVYAAAQAPTTARRLGALSDLACFWPRESHPMVPPCYALKVVPELAARAAEHLAEPNTRVVLAGHSQGTMIVAAATTRLLAGLSEQDTGRLGIVLAGSPLQSAYSRAFPAVVPHDGLCDLHHDLAGRWRTLCRGTDPIGGGVTTWRRQVFDEQLIGVGFRADGTSGALSPAVVGPTGALVLGGDHWLPDPQRGPFPGRRWAPGVLHHQDYISDPEWDRAVACAAGMESPVQTSTRPTVFRLPGSGLATG
ncbi:MAG TPA: hypothetical protein VH333_15910 [Pseudonocardiaceae bacterium]|nr:hypothetical protein [Pseudonocardiaceae bacterium]